MRNHSDALVSSGITSASVISASFTFSVNRMTVITTIVRRLDDELGETVLQQLLELLDVAGHPGHDHAGPLGGVEVEAEALKVGEHADAQVIHDRPRRAGR